MDYALRAGTSDFRRGVEAMHRACLFNGDFIPAVYNGQVFAGVLDLVRDPNPGISAADFVMNMEALGVQFWIMKNEDGTDRLLQPEGYHMLPAHWIPRAEKLRTVFPVERDDEIVAFLRQRGDIAVGEKHKTDPALALLERWERLLEEAEEAEDNTPLRAEIDQIEKGITAGNFPMPTTQAGAAAALTKALMFDEMQPQDATLVRSALVFLEGRASA